MKNKINKIVLIMLGMMLSVSVATSCTITATTTAFQYNGGYNISCNGGSNGNIVLTTKGGISPYGYDWEGPNGYVSTDQNPAGLLAGTYHVTVTDADANGCSTTASVILTQPAVLIATASGTNLFCNGGNNGTVSVVATGGILPYNYLWNNTSIDANQNGMPSGVYSVTVTDANGCSTNSSMTITQPVLLMANAIGTNINCNSIGTASVSVSGGIPPYGYYWNNGATTAIQSGLPEGTYNVTVTDASGCSINSSVTIASDPEPTPDIYSYYSTTFCEGNYDLLYSDNYETFAAHLWSTGETTNYLYVYTSGTYCVTVTDANGCTDVTCIDIIMYPNPVPVIAGNNAICVGKSIVLDAGIFASYNWSTNAVTRTINVNLARTYLVTVTNANGCTAIAAKYITMSAYPVATIAPVNPQCAGINLNLTGGPAAMVSYSWTGPNAFTSNVQYPVIPNAQSAASGSYYLTVSDINGCTGVTTRVVKVNVNPVAAVNPVPTSAPTTICPGSSITLSANPAPPISYLWNTGSINRTIVVSATGLFTVTVTNTNGCTGTASKYITAYCIPPANLTTVNITKTTAQAKWTSPVCFYNYLIRYKKRSDINWTIPASNNFNNIQYMFSGLTRNTTYDWQIRTNCNASGTIYSVFTETQSFTTLARLENYEPENSLSSFNVYPNPAKDNLTIVFSSDKEQTCNLRLADITGRIIINQEQSSVVGDNQYELNLSGIPKGLYLVLLQNGDAILQTKVVVQ